MIDIVYYNEKEKWNKIVYSFSDYDIYYLLEYVEAFRIHGDGDPLLIYYTADHFRAMCVCMLRSIPNQESLYDIITPYGYGGFITEGDHDESHIRELKTACINRLSKEGIVSFFLRYHPILDNAPQLSTSFNTIPLGKTISMDLSSEELIWSNITSKNRNMIRKAKKNGIEIKHSKGMNILEEFMQVYNATMERDDADPYYFFEKAFYESIADDLQDHYELFYAEYEGRKIAMAIMLFANGYMHYHLSGSLVDYRNLAPSNLLIYEAAVWGHQQGFRSLHLGGGLGSEEDNLYKFKAAFNRNSDCQFFIGKEIIDQPGYDKLVKARVKEDPSFDINNTFFPLYRSQQSL